MENKAKRALVDISKMVKRATTTDSDNDSDMFTPERLIESIRLSFETKKATLITTMLDINLTINNCQIVIMNIMPNSVIGFIKESQVYNTSHKKFTFPQACEIKYSDMETKYLIEINSYVTIKFRNTADF